MTRNVSILLIFAHLFMLVGPAFPKESKIQMEIRLVKGKKIAANKGSDVGVEVNMIFQIQQDGEVIGTARVTRLKEDICALVIEHIEKNIKIEPGDLLVSQAPNMTEAEELLELEEDLKTQEFENETSQNELENEKIPTESASEVAETELENEATAPELQNEETQTEPASEVMQTTATNTPRNTTPDYFYEGHMTAENEYSGGGAVGGGLAAGCLLGLIGWGIGYAVVSGMDADVPYHHLRNLDKSSRVEFINGYKKTVKKKRKTKFNVGAAMGTLAAVLIVMSAQQ